MKPMDDLMLPPLPEPTWMMPESIAGKWDIPGAFTSEQMREYARKAVEAERKACAKLVWSMHDICCDIPSLAAGEIAKAIRARR